MQTPKTNSDNQESPQEENWWQDLSDKMQQIQTHLSQNISSWIQQISSANADNLLTSAWILGKFHAESANKMLLWTHFRSLIWMTYRTGFSPISSNGKSVSGGRSAEYTSDIGWGCMIRSGQTMLAQALVFVHLGRGAVLLVPLFNIVRLETWK